MSLRHEQAAEASLPCNILRITDFCRDDWQEVLEEAVKSTIDRLYIILRGPDSPETASADLLEDIAEMLKPIANRKPRLDVVPLLSFAGWSEGQVANLTDLRGVFLDHDHTEVGTSYLQSLNELRAETLPPLQGVELSARQLKAAPLNTQDGEPCPAQGEHACERADAHRHSSLVFDHVAVGGTFDRLHVGHRLLLAATALICTQRVYVGVTGDKLLEKKKHFELLETYDQRAAAAESYIKSVRPALTVQTGALLDPKEPTAAATEEGMQALVVSKETVSGGEAINQYRREHGFAPLELVVVDLVADSAAVEGGKVSSTALREQDAAAGCSRAADPLKQSKKDDPPES
ncbi:probable phosphopantetheine adenylyltransferase at C-terminar half [Coccomyxa sp. Obi]|nr:probable phosphopantetheine adenylyltransferase at C-terminar half [Coccomyxa sp. Obi]